MARMATGPPKGITTKVCSLNKNGWGMRGYGLGGERIFKLKTPFYMNIVPTKGHKKNDDTRVLVEKVKIIEEGKVDGHLDGLRLVVGRLVDYFPPQTIHMVEMKLDDKGKIDYLPLSQYRDKFREVKVNELVDQLLDHLQHVPIK